MHLIIIKKTIFIIQIILFIILIINNFYNIYNTNNNIIGYGCTTRPKDIGSSHPARPKGMTTPFLKYFGSDKYYWVLLVGSGCQARPNSFW
jgi:hypothetical protein